MNATYCIHRRRRAPLGSRLTLGAIGFFLVFSVGTKPALAGLFSSTLLDQIIEMVAHGADSDGSQSVTEAEATAY